MPKPSQRNKSLRKVFVRTPGGKTTLHYRRRNSSKAKCAECGKPLAGVPNKTSSALKLLAKSKKRPERKYGGHLCSACARKKIIAEARLE